MATTTNYGWDTPDDTDLVKDGASAIRTLGSSIDTTTKNLNPQTTTGDIAYRSVTANTNTRLAIGSTGQVLTVAAGVPSWATPSDQTPLTTKGDLFTFSTVDARLGVGANGTVLTADSAEATGLKWATPSSGALALVSTTTLSASGSFNITSCFSATYDDYFILIDEIVGSTGSYFNYGLRTGSTNSTASYKYVNYAYTFAGSNGSSNSTGDSSMGALDWTTTDADAGSLFITLRGPYLAKATQSSIQKSQNAGASMQNGLHAVATSYESMWFTVNSGTVSGKIRIYGLAK